jgi:hypothetical protein
MSRPLDEMGIEGRTSLLDPFSGIYGLTVTVGGRACDFHEDVRDARVFLTSARVVALVENRAALEHLADCGAPESVGSPSAPTGCRSTRCTSYCPRSNLSAAASGRTWSGLLDLGGLRIAGKLIAG